MSRIFNLDGDGQPPARINALHRTGRDVDELLGFCRGILADGKIAPEEVHALDVWIKNHPDALAKFPTAHIANRLQRVFSDGLVTPEECADFKLMLHELTGQEVGLTAPSTLPLDTPPPAIEFENQAFCFTGKFCCGTRSWCQDQVLQRFGMVDDNPRQGTDYLVIGTIGSRDWKHSSFGNKILRALELQAGSELYIVSEEHWTNSLHPL